jgi:DUF2917 family protein
MPICASDVRMQLRKGNHLKLQEARGARLNSVSGAAWITVERNARDIVILAGDSFIVPSDRLVLVNSLSGMVTLDLHNPRDAESGALTHRRGPIGKIWAFIARQERS